VYIVIYGLKLGRNSSTGPTARCVCVLEAVMPIRATSFHIILVSIELVTIVVHSSYQLSLVTPTHNN